MKGWKNENRAASFFRESDSELWTLERFLFKRPREDERIDGGKERQPGLRSTSSIFPTLFPHSALAKIAAGNAARVTLNVGRARFSNG